MKKLHSTSIKFNGGFTIIELVVTLSIAAILSLIAVPSFLDYLRNAEVGDYVNRFTEPLTNARDKITSTAPMAVVVPNGNNRDWRDGWVIFLDKNSNFTLDDGEEVIEIQGEVPPYINVRATGTADDDGGITHLTFTQSNTLNRAGGFGALTIEFSRNDTQSEYAVRRIKIASTGRVRVCRPVNDITCTFD